MAQSNHTNKMLFANDILKANGYNAERVTLLTLKGKEVINLNIPDYSLGRVEKFQKIEKLLPTFNVVLFPTSIKIFVK
jgi:hypothetical protein